MTHGDHGGGSTRTGRGLAPAGRELARAGRELAKADRELARVDRELARVDTVLKALADPTRVRIVGLLLSGEICVCHIHETLNIPQSKASRHLAYLRRAGIVTGEKRGLWVYYRLASKETGTTQVLIDAVRHCIGHLPTVQRDGAKLAKKTGCCVPAPAGEFTLSCCAPASVEA